LKYKISWDVSFSLNIYVNSFIVPKLHYEKYYENIMKRMNGNDFKIYF